MLFITRYSNDNQRNCYTFQESNKLLEIEEYALISKAIDILQNVNTITKVSTKTEANGSVALEITRLEGFPVKLNISLKEGSKEEVREFW